MFLFYLRYVLLLLQVTYLYYLMNTNKFVLSAMFSYEISLLCTAAAWLAIDQIINLFASRLIGFSFLSILIGRFGMKNKHQVYENRKGCEVDIKYITLWPQNEVRRKLSAKSSLILIRIWFNQWFESICLDSTIFCFLPYLNDFLL